MLQLGSSIFLVVLGPIEQIPKVDGIETVS